MKLIPVLIIFGTWHLHGTQRNLAIHIPVYVLNPTVLHSICACT